MAGDTITLTFKVAEDGSLKAISKDAEKAASSTNKAAGAAGNFNKQQKGVAGATSNSTKAFSKMNQTMGGSNGLVAAYAGLAANIFALTAGFGALSRAARATQLEQGLLAMGEASGLAMHTLSRGLVEATGHAISLEESMRSVALITSAGIDAGSIERFGQVARKAATALGRDVQDSISRLTRGVTKLEPELLDELGIMVRLDEASKTYADSIGKTVSELTNFEKRQAFLNATLSEGEKKFGALGDIDVNPFDKLSAALQNIAKSGIGTLSSMLAPIVGYLSSSPMALVGVLALFGSTISSVVLGSLHEMAEGTKKLAVNQREHMANQMDIADGNNRASKTMESFTSKVRDGTVAQSDLDSVIIGQTQSQRTNLGLLRKNKDFQEEYNKRIKVSKQQIQLATQALNEHNLAQVQDSASTAQLAFANGDLSGGFKELKTTFSRLGTTMKTAFKNTTSLRTAFNGLSISGKALATSLKAVGAGFMAMLGPIGLVLSIGMLIFDMFKAIFNFFKSDATKEFEKKTEALASAQEELSKNLKEVDSGLADTSLKITTLAGAYTALDNTLSTFINKYNELAQATEKAGKSQKAQFNAMTELLKSSATLSKGFKEHAAATGGVEKSYRGFNAQAMEFLTQEKNKAAAIRNVAETTKTATDAISKYIQSAKIDTAIDDVVAGIQDINKAIFEVGKNGRFEIKAELLADENAGRLISESLTADQALILNVSAEKKALDEIQKDTKKRKDSILALKKEADGMAWYSKGSQAHNALLAQMKEEQKQININKREQQEIAKTLAPITQERQNIVELEQSRLALAKQTIEAAKLDSKIAKTRKANTISSINEQIEATKALNTAQLENQVGLVTFLESEQQTLLQAQKTRALTKDETMRLLDLEVQITKEKKEQLLLEIESKENSLRENLKREKTRLAMVQEEQKVEKQILSIRNKAASVGKEELKIRVDLAKLEQRNNNRAAQLNGKLLPSQIASIELDSKVLKDKILFMKADASNKITGIKMEKTLLQAKLAVLREEMNVINAKRSSDNQINTSDLDSLIASLDGGNSVFEQQVANVRNELALGLGIMLEQVQTTDIQAMKDAERLSILVKQKEESLDVLSTIESMTGELKKQSDLGTQLANIKNTGLDGKVLNLDKAFKVAETARKNSVEFAKQEFALLKTRIEAEESLLDAKYALLKAEMSKDGNIDTNEAAVLTALSAANAKLKDLNSEKMKTLKMELGVIEARSKLGSKQAIYEAGIEGGGVSAIKAIMARRQAKAELPEGSEGTNKGEVVTATQAVAAVDSSMQAAIQTLIQELATPKVNLSNIDTNVAKIAAGGPIGGGTGGTTGTTTTTSGEGVGPEFRKKPGEEGSVYTPTDVPTAAKARLAISDSEINEGIKAGRTLPGAADKPSLDISIPKPSIAESASEATEGTESAASGASESLKNTKVTIDEVRAATAGFAADMAKLGPEGEIISQFIMGMDSAMGAFQNYGIALAEIDAAEGSSAYNHEKRIAMADAAAAGIAATQQMLAANSAHKVQAIDKEIAAERKRDGYSAASVAKIRALEKKKEATKRKAFENQKKLQMAAVVAATASSIMTALGAPPYGLGPIFGSPMAAFAAVTGALQLATIAKTSYDGGGTSAPSAPGKISAGSRTNTVDLAKGQNMAGELAYTRGGMGAGNMTNFRTAFTGYKHRAQGGYIVGEQGPELFMPETPGTIVPADETEDMAGGAPVNVNFSIQTIDSSTMQETLQGQRANIISMIRDAAHTNGEQFLEDVDLSEAEY